MQKIALYACVALASSVPALATSVVAAPLSAQTTDAPARPTLLELLRHGADDDLNHRRHGRGRDDGANHHSNQASSEDHRSSSSGGHGADDGAGHDRHGGGNHGGGEAGDDHGGRR